MTIQLTDEQLMIRDMVRDFAREVVAPEAAERDHSKQFPGDILKQMGELGLMGMMIPPEYGGSGADTVTYVLALSEIAAACASTAVVMSVQNSIVCESLLHYGTEAQKERFLKPLAQGDRIGAFALTEPDAGSDPVSQKTKAVRDGDAYILTGTKRFITSGKNAEVILVTAKTDASQRHKGISTFIVTPDAPGFKTGREEDKMGLRASDTTDLIFDDCRIPADQRLGDEGQGFALAMKGLDGGRIGIAAQARRAFRAQFVGGDSLAHVIPGRTGLQTLEPLGLGIGQLPQQISIKRSHRIARRDQFRRLLILFRLAGEFVAQRAGPFRSDFSQTLIRSVLRPHQPPVGIVQADHERSQAQHEVRDRTVVAQAVVLDQPAEALSQGRRAAVKFVEQPAQRVDPQQPGFVFVQNLGGGVDLGPIKPAPHHPQAKCVQRGDLRGVQQGQLHPQPLILRRLRDADPQGRTDPLLHLGSGCLREGDHQQFIDVAAKGFGGARDQVRAAFREHRGLAGTRSRRHQDRPIHGLDG